MIYNRTTWENSPSTNTPINAQNLNKIEQGITDAANEINTLSHMVNVGPEVEEDSRINFIKSKNLFDKNNVNKLVGYFNEGTPTITSNEFNRTLYLPCNGNTTYTITIPDGTGAYAIGYTTTTPTIGSSVSGVSNNNKTITTGANAKYLVMRYFQTNNATITEQQAFNGIQIEEGSTATPYEEYITPSIIADDTEFYSQDNYEQYSLNETRIGTYLGKPLYRKVIDFGALPNATAKSVAHGISNIDKIVKIDGITYANQNYSPIPLIYNSSEAQYNTEIYVGGSNITMRSTQNRSNTTAMIYLEYTKTTD